MPIYEYKCNVCNKTEEIIEDLSSSNCHTCHSCGTEMAMERQLSTVNTGGAFCRPSSTESQSCKGSGCNCPFAR